MEIDKLDRAKIILAHEILGSGEFRACREAIRSKVCRGCCGNGTVPFPGEAEFLSELQQKGEIPSSVLIKTYPFYGMSNCLDTALGCKMGDFRPIVCKMYPQINPYPRLGIIFHEPNTKCPSQKFLSGDFETKTIQARSILMPFLLSTESLIRVASFVPKNKYDLARIMQKLRLAA